MNCFAFVECWNYDRQYFFDKNPLFVCGSIGNPVFFVNKLRIPFERKHVCEKSSMLILRK
jgi:hypothetical protein